MRREAGVTLVEMVIAMAIIGLIAAISFPSVSSGIDTLRLLSASNSTVSFINSGLNRAERKQYPVEVTVSREANNLQMRSVDPSFLRTLELPDGITIERIFPLSTFGDDEEQPNRSFMIYPGGAPPPIGIQLTSRKRNRKLVRVDPISGVALIDNVEATP